jgi:hypothetical protein
LFHPLQALGNGGEAIVELETGSRQRWSAIVREGTPDSAAVSSYDLGLGSGASLHGSFKGAHATDVFFEDLLGMAVRLVDGFRGFLEVMEVTELVRHLG